MLKDAERATGKAAGCVYGARPAALPCASDRSLEGGWSAAQTKRGQEMNDKDPPHPWVQRRTTATPRAHPFPQRRVYKVHDEKASFFIAAWPPRKGAAKTPVDRGDVSRRLLAVSAKFLEAGLLHSLTGT